MTLQKIREQPIFARVTVSGYNIDGLKRPFMVPLLWARMFRPMFVPTSLQSGVNEPEKDSEEIQ